MSISLSQARSPGNEAAIRGLLPPKPQALLNDGKRRKQLYEEMSKVPIDNDPDAMVSTYPLLRRILQSRKLHTDSATLKGAPTDHQRDQFAVQVANPNLKYEFLEYLVEEENEAQAVRDGKDRGGRSKLLNEKDLQFGDMAFITLSKMEKKPNSPVRNNLFSTIQPASASSIHKDAFSLLKEKSIHSLAQRKVNFKTCPLHNEEMVMYDKYNQRLICCRCLAVMQLRPDYDTKDIAMSDDYCLQWSLQWRELSQKISQVKELLTNRATINGLLYTQIQNFVIKEALHARFKPTDFEASPLVITQFAQRIYEAEQLILDYESTSQADSIHQMELTFHLYTEDLKKINDLVTKSDMLRENLLVETLGRHIVNQLDEAREEDGGASSDGANMFGQAPQPLDSSQMNVDEYYNLNSVYDPNGMEVEVSRKSIVSTKKPPTTQGSRATYSALKSKHAPSVSFATYGQSQSRASSHQRSTTSLGGVLSSSTKAQDKGCVAISKISKRAADNDFWEDSKAQQNGRSGAHEMVDLLHNLSSLRIQLRQACALAETLKQQAIECEARGDPFKALELMTQTHTKILEIRNLEERIEGVKRTIKERQQQQSDIRNYSRNSTNRLATQQKNQTQSFKRPTSSSQTRPYKYLKDVI